MITKARRNLYIGIIIACAIGIFASFTMFKPKNPESNLDFQQASDPGLGGETGNQGAIQVFPQSSQFDLSVFESDKFKLLKPYTPMVIDKSELGRDDPFKPY